MTVVSSNELSLASEEGSRIYCPDTQDLVTITTADFEYLLNIYICI